MRISRRTRIAGIAFVLAGSLTLTACGGNDSDSKADDNVITVYGTNPQRPLLPADTIEVGGGDPMDNLYAGLVTYATDGTMSNEVAESIEPNADNTVWTVKLKDWKFSDGTPVTAESFVKAWNFGASEKAAQLGVDWFAAFVGTNDEGVSECDTISCVKVVDDKTFTITLKEGEPDFPLRLGYTAYNPLPESAYGSDGMVTKEFGQAPIGNGPYKLTDAGWEQNKSISLEPNPEYDGARKAQNDGIVFKFYAGNGADAAFLDVQSDILDVLDQVPPSQLTSFETNANIQAFNEPGSQFQSFTIPESLAHFKGEEGRLRRQALSLAIDRKLITDKIFNGVRTPASDFTSSLMPGWTDAVPGNEVLENDAAKAKQLWAEADKISKWSGKFQIAYNSDGAGHKEWTEAATNQISSTLGIDASPKAYATFAELRTDVTARTIGTAFRTGWQADYPSILNYLTSLYSTGAGANDGDYSNKEFDKLITQAASAEGDERYDLVTQAQAVLMQDLPAVPLWYYNSTAAVSKGVKDFEFNWKGKPEYYKLNK
jgi:oligopeptide transport system substrate-binding protein